MHGTLYRKKNATWHWREHTCPWHDLLISPRNCNWHFPYASCYHMQGGHKASSDKIMFQSPEFWSSYRWTDRRTDRQKAMYKSPLCICTGVIKKCDLAGICLPYRVKLNSHVSNCYTLHDMNYFLVLSFDQVTPDGRKAMHMSPPWICTGVLTKLYKHFKI